MTRLHNASNIGRWWAGLMLTRLHSRGRAAFYVDNNQLPVHLAARPCFSSLERIQKLEREAEELRNSLMKKLKVTRRAYG